MPSATLITSTPTFITPEEHKTAIASTPTSFSDIPPVLRHKETNVAVSFDPPLDNFGEQDSAQGTLLIAESALVFVSSTSKIFQIEYPAITLHAISRTDSKPSIYCQLDERAGETAVVNVHQNDDDVSDMRELLIIPSDTASLEPIFEALSLCASLHPDPLDAEDDMDDAFIDAGDGTFETFDGDENEELSEVGRAALEHLESIIVYPDGEKK